jgi:hypothetical protein
VLLVQIKLQRATGCQAKNNDILKASVETVPLAKHPFALPLPDNLRYNVVHSSRVGFSSALPTA